MRDKNRWIILGLCLVICIVITILLFNEKIYILDNKFYNILINFKSKKLTYYFKFITKFADTITIIILSIISLLTLFLKRKESLYLVGTIIISTIVNQSLKHLFLRPRPIDINMIIETGYSFPSGHSMASVSFYGFIIYLIFISELNSKTKWIINTLLTLLIISICLSRIYLGVHYLSDVIVGALLSLSLLLVVTYYIKRGEKKYEKSLNNWSE